MAWTASRPGLPMRSPIIRIRQGRGTVRLPGVVDGPRLANDRDLDLAGVSQAGLDLLDHVAGELGRGHVVDLLGAHQDADFAAGLDGVERRSEEHTSELQS